MNAHTHSHKPGLFLVCFNIGQSESDYPRLTVNLNIHSTTGKISGFGWITQRTYPSVNVATRLEGFYQPLAVISNECLIDIEAIGYPVIDWLPRSKLSAVLKPNLKLRLVVDERWQQGSARYQYRTGTFDNRNDWINVKYVPVTTINAVSFDSAA
ncbi:MAG TPA: DUF1842 domain-containing protein [Dongiaceae bacterium]|nr:DUF1842 domain-containing protein [Dongiaceae bacterium]